MFRQNLKNNLKNKIICNNKSINDIFDLIKVIIDFDDKLYKSVLKNNTINFIKKQKSSLS